MEQFKQYFVGTIKNRYADFEGKATRSEYWYFILFYFVIVMILGLIDINIINPMLGMTSEEASGGGLLQAIFAFGMIVPFIALGTVVLIYFFVQKSK